MEDGLSRVQTRESSTGKVTMENGNNDVSADLFRRVTPTPPDPTSALRTVIQLTLRTDLRRVLAGCPLEHSGLRENLSTISEHARQHDIHAEQLLVLIKEACTALPEGRELLIQPKRAGTLAKLISMAVEEYYGPANPAR